LKQSFTRSKLLRFKNFESLVFDAFLSKIYKLDTFLADTNCQKIFKGRVTLPGLFCIFVLFERVEVLLKFSDMKEFIYELKRIINDDV